MRIDFAGRVAKFKLHKGQSLLPLIEAVINSFHSIDDAGLGAAGEIRIVAEREQSLTLGEEADRLAPIESFTVEDNGIGFTDENQQSFETSDSLYKKNRGGKGVGRMLWLKAFDSAEVVSTFGIGELMMARKFSFALPDGVDSIPTVQTATRERKTSIKLVNFKEPWRSHAPRHLLRVATAIVEHCFLYFLRPQRPRLVITDGFETIDLNGEFDREFVDASWNHKLSVKGHAFNLRGFRMRTTFSKAHHLVLAADFREVMQYQLGKYMPNLQLPLTAEDGGPFWYFAVVQSSYLDENVNTERTGFEIPDRIEAQEDFSTDPTLQDIRQACIAQIATDLTPFTQKIEVEKTRRLDHFVATTQPKYRPIVNQWRTEALAELKPNANDEEMDAVLHGLRSRKELETRRQAQAIIDTAEPENGAEHTAKVSQILSNINAFEMSALAEYVVHRKLVLELFQRALERNKDTDKYELESVVHNIVFPMRTTSDDEGVYDKQNLWLIDERLTFHSYLSSDKSLKSVKAVESDSALRPDILIFDRPFLFGANIDEPLTSILIIEFKRPVRENYDEDPVTQVYKVIRDLRDGHIKDTTDRPVRPANNQIPAYCYVIADLTPALEIKLQNMGGTRSPDNQGYFGFNQNLNAYYEVISYSKVLSDAKKRNRVLFDKLHLS